MKGRKPKTTEEHKAQGTYDASRHRDRLKHPMLTYVPQPPDEFTEGQKHLWISTCAMLLRDGQLSDTYLMALEHYCNAWLIWDKAYSEVAKSGVTFSTDSGQIKTNPAVQVAKEMLALMMRILEQFGYTPRAAMSIKVTSEGKTDDDPLLNLNDN